MAAIPILQVPQPGANNSATTTAAAAGSDLEAVRQFLGMELAVHVNIRACQEDEWEVCSHGILDWQTPSHVDT